MAITRTRLNGSPSKQLVSSSARKLLGITSVILKSDDPAMQLSNLESRDSRIRKEDLKSDHVREHYINGVVSVWDASSVGGATGDSLITTTLPVTPGAAQGYFPLTKGLVVQTDLECVVIWDT